MKLRILAIGLMLFLVVPLVLAQQPVDLKKLTEAKEKGNVLFKSVLKNADMIVFQKSRQHYAHKYWTLKFENGAVFNIEESDVDKNFEDLGHIWWIGKQYVVYYEKTPKKAIIHIELIEEKEKRMENRNQIQDRDKKIKNKDGIK